MRYSDIGVTDRRIRVISIMEADFVTGPAKNLLEFAQRARQPREGAPAVDLSVVAYLRGGQPETAFIRATREAGIPLDIVQERGRFDRSVITQLRQVVQARSPHLVQTHNVKSHFFMRASGIWRDSTWLAFHHGYKATDFKMRLYNQMDRWSLRAAAHVLTVCGSFVDLLAGRGIRRERMSVQHNAVRKPAPAGEAAIHLVRAQLEVPDGTSILVSIGRLSYEKGHLDLVRALAKVREQRTDFHLVIVGEGPERTRIEAERRRLNLDAHITLAGLRHNVQTYYMLADVVVLPSHSEGSPNVLLEAMINARPIVATRVGGVPEIVTHEETALLVPPRDPESLAKAIVRVLDETALRTQLAESARAVAETVYSPEAYARSMVGLYMRLLENRQRS